MSTALVTTYNEADTIGGLVVRLSEFVDLVVVVDDQKSSDGTGRIAAAFGALVLPGYTGFGPCLQAGFRHLEDESVVVIDAGGSHDPDDIPALMDLGADVAIGSRFMPGARYVGDLQWRPVASRFYAKACSLRTRQHITDWTSGYRCYSPDAVKTLANATFTARRHAWQAEALAECFKAGLFVDETPITYRLGRSSFNKAAAVEALGVLARLSC